MTSIINNAFEAVKTAANHGEQVKALNTLKVTELRELAKWQSIRLTGKTRKADIIEAVIVGMRQNIVHFMENAMHGTRKSLNITRENLNENLNSAYLDNGYSFTPETIKTFAKAFYNIELGQGDALDLTREFLTKINSKIFKLVAHFDELDEAEAVVSKFENKHSKEEREAFLSGLTNSELKAAIKYSYRRDGTTEWLLPLFDEKIDSETDKQNLIKILFDNFYISLESKIKNCMSWDEVAVIIRENHLNPCEASKVISRSGIYQRLPIPEETADEEAEQGNAKEDEPEVKSENKADRVRAEIEKAKSFNEVRNIMSANFSRDELRRINWLRTHNARQSKELIIDDYILNSIGLYNAEVISYMRASVKNTKDDDKICDIFTRISKSAETKSREAEEHLPSEIRNAEVADHIKQAAREVFNIRLTQDNYDAKEIFAEFKVKLAAQASQEDISARAILKEIGKRKSRDEREDYLRSLNEEAVRNILRYAHRQENMPDFVLQKRCKGIDEMDFQEVVNQAINVFFRMLEMELWECTTWEEVAVMLKNNHVTADEARKIIRHSWIETKLANMKKSVEAIIKGLKEASETSNDDCDGGGSCIGVKINPAPELEAKLETCGSFSEVINFVKENHITANDFYALADKSMQGLERKGLYEMAVNYCEAHCLELDTNKPYYERFEELFRYLVPGMGAADTLAGELIRALARIESRYYSNGDWIGIDYGRKTCNPSARFLRQYGNKNIADSIEALWTDIDERDYERHLSRLIFHVVNYIDANTEMKYLNFTVAIESCRDPEQDIDDDDSYDDERCNYTYEFKPFDLESLKGGEISNLFTRYNKIKEQYPSTLMLFKTGDYYKAYDRDAEITAETLDIALHDVRQPRKLMRAEIPAYAIDFYARVLNKRGFKTVIFEKSLEEFIAQKAEVAEVA